MKTTLILDTDIGLDCDDAGAMAILHGQAARCGVAIGAVVCSSPLPETTALIAYINRHYGAAEIPVGRPSALPPDYGTGEGYARSILQTLAPQCLGREYPAAVPVLRRTLCRCADGSAVYVAVGPQSNMAALLQSEGDEMSPLTGRELLRRKLKTTLVMAGRFVEALPEFNVAADAHAAQTVADRWPGEMVYVPFELGEAVISGGQFAAAQGQTDPAAMAYCLSGNEAGRYSWDPITVLQALFPDNPWFGMGEPGRVTVADNGMTAFCADPTGNHRILGLAVSAAAAEQTLDYYLCAKKGDGI